MKRSFIAIVTMAVLALSPASAFASESILSEAEQLELKSILTCVKYVGEGVDKKPTVRVSGCNVQIVNGEGSTETTNGEGNLVVGYDELPEKGSQSGSHNIILGKEQAFTGYGSIIGGKHNFDSRHFDAVFGFENETNGQWSSVLGGSHNLASGDASVIAGGDHNKAVGHTTSILGGGLNE